jgi:hypothetical protein
VAAVNVAVTSSVSPSSADLSPPVKAPTLYKVPLVPPFVLSLTRPAPPIVVESELIAWLAFDAVLLQD